MATFGERLRLLREEKGLSQDELGKILNLSQSTIAYYETNKKEPTRETIIKIADLFKVSLDYLFCRSDIRNPLEIQAAHRVDDPMDELPVEARRSLEEFKQYILQKYGKKN